MPFAKQKNVIVLIGFLSLLYLAFPFVMSTGEQDYRYFFADDFYYYLVIARNLVDQGVSTFDGIHATNGYHPLWMLTLSAIYGVTHSEYSFFLAMVGMMGVCAVLNAALALRLLTHVYKDIAAPVAYAAVGIYAFLYLQVGLRTGMEVTLACPLILLSIYYALRLQHTSSAALPFMLSAAFAVLARIDAALIYCIMLVMWLMKAEGRKTIHHLFANTKQSIGVFLCGAPVLLYVAINHLYFGTILPVSGMAKQINDGPVSPINIFPLLFTQPLERALYGDPLLLIIATIPAILMVIGSLAHHRAPTPVRALYWFALLFYLIQASFSDWRWWAWYFYPLTLVTLLVVPLVMQHLPNKTYKAILLATATGIIALCGMQLRGFNPEKLPLTYAINDLAVFSESHTGIYGMGDMAGLTGYVLKQPLVQLEGLVNDRPYLDYIRNRTPLIDILKEQHIDYYVNHRVMENNGCYEVREPAVELAGERSYFATGTFCQQPLVLQGRGNNALYVFKVE